MCRWYFSNYLIFHVPYFSETHSNKRRLTLRPTRLFSINVTTKLRRWSDDLLYGIFVVWVLFDEFFLLSLSPLAVVEICLIQIFSLYGIRNSISILFSISIEDRTCLLDYKDVTKHCYCYFSRYLQYSTGHTSSASVGPESCILCVLFQLN